MNNESEVYESTYLDLWLPTVLSYNQMNALVLKSFGNQDLLNELVKNELGETESKSRINLITHKHQNTKDDVSKMILEGNYLQAIDNITNVLNQKKNEEKFDNLFYQLWFTRIAIYLKLRDVTSVEQEIEDIYIYEKQAPMEAIPNKTDYDQCDNKMIHSNIPFSLRILHSLFPAFKKEYDMAVQRISKLIQDTLDILNRIASCEEYSSPQQLQPALKLWTERHTTLQYNLVTCLLLSHDYESAFNVLEDILQKESYALNSDCKMNLTLYLTRILMQFGNVTLAQKVLSALESSPHISLVSADNLQLHKGYLSLTLNEYQEAKLHFENSYKNNHLNKPIAMNNIALVLLYSGKLKEAIEFLEKEIEADPENTLHECIIYNLSSMYDLRSSNNIYYKRLLLTKVARIKGDGFVSECFKLT